MLLCVDWKSVLGAKKVGFSWLLKRNRNDPSETMDQLCPAELQLRMLIRILLLMLLMLLVLLVLLLVCWVGAKVCASGWKAKQHCWWWRAALTGSSEQRLPQNVHSSYCYEEVERIARWCEGEQGWLVRLESGWLSHKSI